MMMKESRNKKVYTRVTPEEYKLIAGVAKDVGFGSTYHLLYALLSLFTRYHVANANNVEDDINVDVEEMFNELSDEDNCSHRINGYKIKK